MGGGVGPRGPRVGGPRVGQQQPRPMNQPGPQPMTMMARPGMPPVPMVGAQVRPQQSFKYTPTARNPPAQVMPGQMVAPGGAPPGPGASDCHYAGRSSTAGAEADAGREALPIDPAYVPRPGRQDHGDAAGDRQRRARPHA